MSKPLLVIGPFPPPTHGQAIATQRLFTEMQQRQLQLKRCDTAGPVLLRLLKHLSFAFQVALHRGPIYLSVNSNRGIWLTLVLAAASALRRNAVFFHYHAFGPIREGSLAVRLMGQLTSGRGYHIGLTEEMSGLLRALVADTGSVLVLNNAGLISPPKQLRARIKTGPVILGHLSNLTAEKGLGVVIEAATLAKKSGLDIELRIAGPCMNDRAKSAIAAAHLALGAAFTYHGPLDGVEKSKFFGDLDLFLFPSRYRNEAAPLVLLEAMAHDVPCIALDVGCVGSMVTADAGVVLRSTEQFIEAVLAFAQRQKLRRFRPRQRFVELQRAYRCEVSEFCEFVQACAA